MICKAEIQNLILFGGKSCWVTNNKYEVFELAEKGASRGLSGNFLVLAQNKSFNYWLLARLTYKVNGDSTVKNISLADSAYYSPIGMYDVIHKDQTVIVTKKVSGKKSTYGLRHPKGKFDEVGARKKAYNTSGSQLIADKMQLGQLSGNSISGGKKVEIYNNRKTPKTLSKLKVQGYLTPPKKPKNISSHHQTKRYNNRKKY